MKPESLHLLITRPEAQASVWAQQLQSLGITVSLQPMLLIEPVEDAAAQRQIMNRILNFDQYQKAIFISQNAVTYGLQWLDKYWPQLPIGVEFFAIGQATFDLLQQGIEQGTVYSAASAMNSETLLELKQLADVSDQKIIIFRGQGGRDFLATELQQRGAQIDYCELYTRQTPVQSPQKVHKDFRSSEKQRITVVHSGETLANLCSIIEADDLLWLQQQPLLVPGQRVAQLAHKAEFTQVIVAENATHDSMLEALYER